MSRKTPSTKKLVIYVHVEGGKNICNIKFIILILSVYFCSLKYVQCPENKPFKTTFKTKYLYAKIQHYLLYFMNLTKAYHVIYNPLGLGFFHSTLYY